MKRIACLGIICALLASLGCKARTEEGVNPGGSLSHSLTVAARILAESNSVIRDGIEINVMRGYYSNVITFSLYEPDDQILNTKADREKLEQQFRPISSIKEILVTRKSIELTLELPVDLNDVQERALTVILSNLKRPRSGVKP